jgi:hypothetical protein
MENILIFMYGKRVKSPMGKGLVIGSLIRAKLEFIVSLDEKPIAVFDKGQNPILVWSFEPKELEILKDER